MKSYLKNAEVVSVGRAQKSLGSAFREPARRALHQVEVGTVGAADEIGARADGGRDRFAPGEVREARERVRHPVERERERDDTAAVDRGGHLGGV